MRKLTVIFLMFSMTMSAQKIDRSRNELRSSSGSSSSSSSVSSNNDDTDGDFIQMFIDGIEGMVRALFGYRSEERHLRNTLTSHPYETGTEGNFSSDTVPEKKFRIDLEDNVLWSSSRLYGNHLKAKIRPSQSFFLQADYRELFERTIDNTTDNLALMHLNFCYDRIKWEKLNFGWNAGVSYVGSGVRKAGFCYGLSADYFPGKRISFSASAKWSKINTHPVNAYEFSGRFHHRQFFAALGFQHLKVATPTYNFIAFGGGFYL